tara:strand:- start:38 stop:1201 length:1164 start_codon:yes stop_codon:yes gene_type:complete
MKKIVIIGGGLSGISCAHYLDKTKYNVKIFESTSRPGGRAKSDYIDNYICDVGFQVLLNNYEQVKNLGVYNKLELRYFDSGSLIYNNDRIYKLYNPIRHPFKFITSDFLKIVNMKDIKSILKILFQNASDSSNTSSLFNNIFSKRLRYYFFEPFFKGIFLNKSLSNDSRFFHKIFKKFAYGKASLPKYGMSKLSETIIDNSNLDLTCNKKILKVNNNKVFFESGEEEEYDILIFSIPIRNINKLLNTNYQSEYFTNKTIYISSTVKKLGKSILLIPNEDFALNSIQCLSNVSKSYSKSGRSLYSASTLDVEVSDKELLKQFNKITNISKQDSKIIKSYTLPYSLPATFTSIDSKDNHYYCGDWNSEPSIDGALKSGRLVASQINEKK